MNTPWTSSSESAGLGYNLNLPLPPGSGDEVFLQGLPTVLVQEGGYNTDTIGRCVASVLAGFEEGI